MHTVSSPFNSWDAVKLVGLALMFVDHTGAFFYTDEQWLRAIGRGAAPVFLFLAGFASRYRFQWELFLLALLLSVSDFLLDGHLRPQNILFNIIACRLIFAWLEKTGRKIEHPYHWYIGALIYLPSMLIMQYGSFGMMFAICGYMQRRLQEYNAALRHHFMLLCFATYGTLHIWADELTPLSVALMSITLYAVYRLLHGLEIRDFRVKPHWLKPPLKLASYYSGYIYVFHLIALEWLTGLPL